MPGLDDERGRGGGQSSFDHQKEQHDLKRATKQKLEKTPVLVGPAIRGTDGF